MYSLLKGNEYQKAFGIVSHRAETLMTEKNSANSLMYRPVCLNLQYISTYKCTFMILNIMYIN